MLTDALKMAAQSTVPNKQGRGRQRWVTEVILNEMEEKRKCKGINQERNRLLNMEIKDFVRLKKRGFCHKNALKLKGLKGEILKPCLRLSEKRGLSEEKLSRIGVVTF